MRLLLLLSLASLCASSALAEGFEKAPYTLPDGRVIIPGENDGEVRSGDLSPTDIYTPLSHNGPMAGVGLPQQNDPRGRGGRQLRMKNRQPQGIRSPHDGGDIL